MNKKVKKLSVEELTKNEISQIENTDKISKLEKERSKDRKIIAEYKEREKATARALVLYERKIKFLKTSMIDDILSLTKDIDAVKEEYHAKCDSEILVKELKESFKEFGTNFTLIADKLYDICNKLEENATITKEDRAFILNKKVEEPKPVDSASRFDRLKQEFNQKIGASVMRKPGRPKKQDQSIVADIGLRKKVEKQVQEKTETMDKLNELFYAAPASKASTSNIPKTSDSLFDFDEALNPNISLKDIMADILAEPTEEEKKQEEASSKIDEVREAQRQSKIELLESGFLRTPHMSKPEQNQKTIDQQAKKKSFEKRFLSIQNITKQ